jgi:ribosomal protein L16 Arg81 hydroxylase
LLTAGDRIYLPARAPHTASVPQKGAVTYVVGQRPSAVRPTKNGEESA